MVRANLAFYLAITAVPSVARAAPAEASDGTVAAGGSQAASADQGRGWVRRLPWSESRELSTDRPDLTESPYTVPTGRFQFEFDVVNYSRDVSTASGAATRVESLAIAPVNMKVGLARNVDLQVVLSTFRRDSTRVTGGAASASSSGADEVAARLKVNLWGNDSGRTALGVMPFVAVTREGAAPSGGLIVPLAVDLGGGFGLGAMAELDLASSGVGQPIRAVVVNSVTVGHDLWAGFAGYVELFSGQAAAPQTPWVGSVDFGLTRGIGPNVQLDAGANIGISRAADDINPFLGFSFRI